MDILLIALLLNLGFAAAITRLSNWFKLKVEDYLFHMLCLNLVVVLLYASRYFGIATGSPILIKFFAALAIAYIIIEPFKNGLLRQIKLLLSKIRG
jgi:hypothetical protein